MDKETELVEIRQKMKQLLVEQLSLEDITSEEIEDDMPLFGEGIGLDSLDAVEIVVLLQRNFDIEIKDLEKSRDVFKSVNTLAEYVYEKRHA